MICDGKFTDAHTPLMSWSFTRALMSQHPGRMSSKFTGSTLTNSRLRPATAFIATWVKRWPSNSQSWCPNSFSTIRGARSAYLAGTRPSNMSGGSTRWSSTEMIE